MGKVSQILRRRSPVIHVMGPTQTVAEAVEVMASQRIGVVPIIDAERLVGIFSERDLLRRVVARGLDADKTRLDEVMTTQPVTTAPGEDRLLAIAKMQGAGCRHLPVVIDGDVIDMISMRDLLFVELETRREEVEALHKYIDGTY